MSSISTASIKNRDRILEAIDQLRRRKARPDVQRICNYLFRRFSINSAEARADLQWCVDNDIVLKVEYKGNTSYRNAAKKFSHLKRLGHQDDGAHDSNKVNRKFTQLLTNAFGELIVQDPDYLEFGVSAEHIIDNILSKDSVRYTRKYISILLEKEVEKGGLIKKENGNYEMGPAVSEKKSEQDEGSAAGQASGGAGRGGGEQFSQSRAPEHLQDSSKDKPRNFPFIHVKPRKRPGPKPGFKKERPTENGDNSMDSDERKSESGSISRVGRKKVSTIFKL